MLNLPDETSQEFLSGKKKKTISRTQSSIKRLLEYQLPSKQGQYSPVKGKRRQGKSRSMLITISINEVIVVAFSAIL